MVQEENSRLLEILMLKCMHQQNWNGAWCKRRPSAEFESGRIERWADVGVLLDETPEVELSGGRWKAKSTK